MKILWVNVRRRARNRRVATRIEKIVQKENVDLTILIEAQGSNRKELFNFISFNQVIISSKFCVLHQNSRRIEVEEIEPLSSIRIITDECDIYGVHLSPYRAADRRKQLEKIGELLRRRHTDKVLIGGDFNLLPRSVDGLYGGEPSKWSTRKEMGFFHEWMTRHKLLDLLADKQPEFTVERKINGKKAKFRCDLVLTNVPESVRAETLHQFRMGEEPLSDHSGLVVEIYN